MRFAQILTSLLRKHRNPNKILLMILSPAIYHKASVYLFHKNNAHKLVREGHFREREAEVCGGFDFIRKAVRASDNEADAA